METEVVFQQWDSRSERRTPNPVSVFKTTLGAAIQKNKEKKKKTPGPCNTADETLLLHVKQKFILFNTYFI